MNGLLRTRICFAMLFVWLSSAGDALAQSATVTINEPAKYSLSEMFSIADRVALVRVVAGDTEAYEVPVYKALVLTAYKGTSDGQVLYFGPYLGTELGSEYMLLLKDSPGVLEPQRANAPFGVVHISRVFNEGYSSMLMSYQCVFDGNVPSKSCDYAVRVCTDYVLLPKSLSTVLAGDVDAPFGCRWVRKSRFTATLEEMSGKASLVR
jgi:hypothetical protein